MAAVRRPAFDGPGRQPDSAVRQGQRRLTGVFTSPMMTRRHPGGVSQVPPGRLPLSAAVGSVQTGLAAGSSTGSWPARGSARRTSRSDEPSTCACSEGCRSATGHRRARLRELCSTGRLTYGLANWPAGWLVPLSVHHPVACLARARSHGRCPTVVTRAASGPRARRNTRPRTGQPPGRARRADQI